MPKLDPGALAKVRMDRRISQRELSRRIGMSNGYIARVERGDYSPPVERVRLIVKVLRTSMRSISGDGS